MEHARAHITDPARVDYRPMNAFLLPRPWHRGRVVVIGDAAKPGKSKEAIASAFEAALLGKL